MTEFDPAAIIAASTILTPHQAGHTQETQARQGWTVVEEIERFLTGQPLQYPVTTEQYAIMS